MATATKTRSDVKDLKLASHGKKRILWADTDMPVLARIRERFAKEKPLDGLRMSACLHVTGETANLARGPLPRPQGVGRGCVVERAEPAQHAGRRCRQSGAGFRHRSVRHPRRG